MLLQQGIKGDLWRGLGHLSSLWRMDLPWRWGLGSFWKEVIQIFCCGVYLELIPIRFHCKTWVLSRKRHWKVKSHTIWTLHELSTLACKFITVGWCVDLSYKEVHLDHTEYKTKRLLSGLCFLKLSQKENALFTTKESFESDISWRFNLSLSSPRSQTNKPLMINLHWKTASYFFAYFINKCFSSCFKKND